MLDYYENTIKLKLIQGMTKSMSMTFFHIACECESMYIGASVPLSALSGTEK